jgi:predicted naringenin-chalcone synthase
VSKKVPQAWELKRVFEKFYLHESQAPSDLIHVSCTGYHSPSAAQSLIAAKNWGDLTTVTHAYHMGCYAAFPALRMARGFLSSDQNRERVDLVHTEICGLHINTSDHALESFVVQTLFADGFIRYSLSPELPKGKATGFEVLRIYESILPNTEDAMTWTCADHGMKMTLSKDVPSLVAKALPGFISRLLTPLQISYDSIRSEAYFAVHPGGPKILDQVQESLGLRADQIHSSREILRTHGNMSSATLPHIWDRLSNDPTVHEGALILSLAFGPGLTICGALLKKKIGN